MTKCTERCVASARGYHSLRFSRGEGDANIESKMLWLCMRWQTRNAKEAILGRVLPQVSFKAGKLHRAAGAEDVTLSNVRTRGSIPKYAMSGKAECGMQKLG